MPSASMARTSSKSAALEIAVGVGRAHDRVERRRRPIRRCAQAATICCARMSSGAFGISQRVESRRCESRGRAPRTRSARRASSRKRRPSGFAPTQWPERPMRCSATAIARGEPSWTTRSTEPMSMPSSSEAVATTARSSPFSQALFDVEAESRAPGCRDAASRSLRRAAR